MSAPAVRLDVVQPDLDYLRRVIDEVSDAVFVDDAATGRIIDVNRRMCEMYGYTREEALCLDIGELSLGESPYGQNEALAWLERARRASPQIFEWRARRKGGELFWAEVSITFATILGEERFVVLVRDISARKAAEAELRDSQERFVAFMDQVPAAAFIKGTDCRTIFVNRHLIELLGAQAWIGKTAAELFPGELGEAMVEDDRRALAAGFQVAIEWIPHLDGSVHVYETRRFAIPRQDKTPLLGGIAVDISERIQAEKELRESGERYRAFLDSTSDMAFVKDEALRYLLVNRANQAFFGRDEAEIVGRTDADLMPPEAAARCRKTDIEAIEAGAVAVSEEEAGGRIYETRKFPLPLGGGRIGVGGFVRDVTEQRRAERERGEIERRLLHSQKLESLGVLAGGIAHDFNNLLMAVSGNLDLALRQTLSDAAAAGIRRAKDVAARAADLTRQMLAYSGRGHFVIGPVDVSALVEEMSGLLRSSVSHAVELDLRLDPHLPVFAADAGQIQQVVLNLIVNAAEAIGETPGRVTIATSVRGVDETVLRCNRTLEVLSAGRFIALEVTDTGCGMDDETQARIFDPFFSTKFTGRGLGMPVVLGVARSHRAAILLDSAPGRGTTVTVLFPCPAVALEAAHPVADAPSGEGRTGRALVVDDEEMVRDALQSLLESEGWLVDTAADGDVALAIVDTSPEQHDVVILDLTMPNRDGASTLAELRRRRPAVPVLLMSGFDASEVMRRVGNVDGVEVLQKPFDITTLFEALGRLNRGGD